MRIVGIEGAGGYIGVGEGLREEKRTCLRGESGGTTSSERTASLIMATAAPREPAADCALGATGSAGVCVFGGVDVADDGDSS